MTIDTNCSKKNCLWLVNNADGTVSLQNMGANRYLDNLTVRHLFLSPLLEIPPHGRGS